MLLLFLLLLPTRCFVVGLAFVFDFDEDMARPGRLGTRGVVLDSASRREAKRGQSTNRKGEMRSRFS